MKGQPSSADQNAQPSGQDIWQMCTDHNEMDSGALADELVFALLTWAAQHPGDGPVAAEHQPLRLPAVDFLAMVGCAHIGTDILAKVQSEMCRRGVRYLFTDPAGDPTHGGAWVRVWLTDYLALGLPGTGMQLRRSRGWFRARAFDIDVRRRMAEAALLRYADDPPDPAKEFALLAALHRVKFEQARFEEALAQMTAPQVEPDA